MQPARANLIATFLILVISVPFLYVLGINYGPVNDAWVWVALIDQQSVTLSKTFGQVLDGDINSRLFRVIPWLFYSEIHDPNFWTIKISMYLTFLLSFLGVFLLIKVFLKDQNVTAFILASLFMLFPYDGTIMWMGASGVNLSFLFAVWSLRNIAVGINEKRNVLFGLGLVLGLMSFLTYPGHIFLYLGILGISLLRFSKSLLHFCLASLASIVTLSLGAIPIIKGLKSGEDRNANVVEIEGDLIWEGFVSAFNTIFTEVPLDILTPDPGYMLAGFATSAAVIGIIYFSGFNQKNITLETESRDFQIFKNGGFLEKFSKSSFIIIVIMIAFFVAGYLPYAISRLRFGVGRELLYARSSILVLIVFIISITTKYVDLDKYKYKKIAPVLLAGILGLIVQEKMKVAKEYRKGSDQVQYFLGELTRVVPTIKDDQKVIIFFEDPGSFRKDMQMTFNRPQFPVGHLYNVHFNKVTVKSLTPTHVLQRNRGVKTITTLEKVVQIDTEKDITLLYNTRTGLRELKNFETTLRRQNIVLTDLPGLENYTPNPVSLTPRQQRYRKFGNE